MLQTPLKKLVLLGTILIVSGCALSTGVFQNTLVPRGTIKYVPCVSLPGPFFYEDENVDTHFPVRMSDETLEWADEYNAVYEELCE